MKYSLSKRHKITGQERLSVQYIRSDQNDFESICCFRRLSGVNGWADKRLYLSWNNLLKYPDYKRRPERFPDYEWLRRSLSWIQLFPDSDLRSRFLQNLQYKDNLILTTQYIAIWKFVIILVSKLLYFYNILRKTVFNL